MTASERRNAILEDLCMRRFERINNLAFNDCTGLTSVTIPDSVTSIGNYVFSGCSGLTSVTIGNGVTSIGYMAFYNCDALTEVHYNGDLTGWLNISGLDNLMAYVSTKTLYIDGTKIEGDLVISEGVESIASRAFYNYSGLTSVTIPNSVTSIGYDAFSGCIGLTSVTIGSSVTSIGRSAFQGCYKLVEVINKSSLNIVKGSSGFGGVGQYALNVKKGGTSEIVNKDGYLFYTYNNTNYLLGYVGKDTQLTLPSDYNGQGYEIYQHAFYNCSGLTSVTIPDSVKSIGDWAFMNCIGLTSVTIGSSVTSIGRSAFGGCSGLTNVTIPDSVTSIGDWAFSYCSNLTSVTIGNGVTSIGDYVFQGCTGLTSVTIPDSVTRIGNSAFYYCSGLTRIDFNGTKAQWESIRKGSDWNCNTGNFTVYCTDGTLSKSEVSEIA